MNRAHGQAGQSLIETALILAAFMGLLLGMAGVGELVFVRQTLADRASQAARWGALNNYDPTAIRDMVLFGTAAPQPSQAPFFGIASAAVEVSNPGCPGVQCRISVAIPEQGIRSVEPMEESGPAPAIAARAVSKP
jgi:Flp pilus assembly protein TadG